METRSAEEIEQSTQRLLDDLNAVVEDSEDLLRAGVQDLSGSASLSPQDQASAALARAKEAQEILQARARQSMEATDRMIRTHPYESVGVAFGIGLLIGVLINRR